MEDKIIPVKVAVRGRPLVDKEISEGCQTCVMFVPGEPQLIIGKDKAFTFDFVYSATSQQEHVYSEAVIPLVTGLFKGYNATVLAYGQTGSGKTYTMGGAYGVNVNEIEDVTGVIPRVIRDLFIGIQERQDVFEFSVKISYLEIYKEDLLDLLVPAQKRDKDQISIREDVNGGIKLIGLTEVEVSTAEAVMQLLIEGSQGRTVGATAMNNQSSRSHAIFTIHIDRKSRSDSDDFCKAKFHLVDLAGSERVKKTQAEGERMKEGININRGLLALGNVISALGDDNSKRGHIPYRDSKLTRLLQDSLGGNSHTLMIACISPADSNMEETISTLRYADRARKIKNKPVVNRDPQTAEILRLRQLVMELQSGKLPVSACSGGSPQSNFDLKNLCERNKKLEEDNRKLAIELQSAISQNTDLTEKFVRSEVTREQLRAQLVDLKQKTGLSISQLLNASKLNAEDSHSDAQTSCPAEILEQNLNAIKEVYGKIEEIEEATFETVETLTPTDNNSTESPSANNAVSDELRNRHVLRQAQLSRELQELNTMLARKQELAGQMIQSDEQMQAMRSQYETQIKDMEHEINSLLKEKEELNVALQSAKSTSNNKLAEQRRKRLQELESQIGELKRKMLEQSKMLKLKEQTDKQVEKLNQEILQMKQQRVKLMNQLKDDAEQFRKLKSEMAKEVLQLKSQDRKRLAEIARLERQHVNQQVVLRRKAEEAAAANNRLKEVLLRQKTVSDERMKKQETADLSGIGARVRKILGEEFDFLVSVEEAKMHLANLLSSRKEITEQLITARKKLEVAKGCVVEENVSAQQRMISELEQQMELCSTQIADLQQKLLDADQDEKGKSRWNNIHTMVEAKCAMKWLLNVAVTNKVECNKKDGEIADIKAMYDETVKSLDAAEEERSQIKSTFEQEIHQLRKETESKVLYLMTQLRPSSVSSLPPTAGTSDKEQLKRIQFLEAEIARLAWLDEELTNKTNECENLRKELTKKQYNRTLGREGSLMPEEVDLTETKPAVSLENPLGFFSPHFCPVQNKRRRTFGKPSDTTTIGKSKRLTTTLPTTVENSDSDEGGSSRGTDDENNDPDWVSGLTPAAFERKPVARITAKVKLQSDCEICKCKTTCSTKKCPCFKDGHGCGDGCGCIQDKCKNRPHMEPESTTDNDTARKSFDTSGTDGSMNQTYSVESADVVSTLQQQPHQSRKRSSDDNKPLSTTDRTSPAVLMQLESNSTEDDIKSDVRLSEGGVNAVAKKRRLLKSSTSFFGDP